MWAAIHLPVLALEALGTAEASDEAVAVAASRTPKAPVLALSAGGRAAGAEVSIPAAAACARSGDLTLKVRDPARETRILDRLAAWSQRFTPDVSLELPDALLLDIGASLKLFGGKQALRDRLRAGLDAQGYTANLALAPTPRAALWLARAGVETTLGRNDQLAGTLGALPLSTLALPERSHRRFRRLGVKTLRQAFRLPRDGLAKRFGPELLRDWDRALGQAPDPRRHWTAAPRFSAERELPHAGRSLDRIAPFIDDLAGELTALLQRQDAGVDHITLSFAHTDCRPTRVTLRLLTVSRDATRIKRLLHTRLERAVLPAPAVSVHLASEAFRAIVPASSALPELQPVPAPKADTLVETLCARLGGQAVFGLQPVADHRPEQAWQPVSVGGQAVTPRTLPSGIASASRPFWLLPAPQALQQRNGRPLYQSRLLVLQGPPERVESGWWESRDIGRDYYRARAANGAWLWLYREHHGGRGWFLHGYFAG